MSKNKPKRMLFGAYISYGAGHHAAAWRHPDSDPEGVRKIEFYREVAQIVDKSAFDLLFLADAPAVFNDDTAGYSGRVASFEPLTLLSHLSAYTKRIGLVGTASTTYNEPYNVARKFASLDLISEGRAGWNMVTTSKLAAAGNFGLQSHLPHEIRYKRAEEFIDIVLSLWDTWDRDAFPADKTTGKYYDPEKRHPTNFEGEFLRLQGELNVPKSPQERPVLVQAGSSNAGLNLAARTAEIVFTAQNDLKESNCFVQDLIRRTRKFRSIEERPKVLPGLTIYAGPTDKDAREKVESLQTLIEPEFGLSMLGDLMGGFDLSKTNINGLLPPLPPSNTNKSRRKIIETLSWEKGLTVKELYEYMTISRGHLTLVGSYDKVAAEISRWWNSGGCDGFNIMPALSPGNLIEFQEEIFPRLESKGIAHNLDKKVTLRERIQNI